MCDEPLNPFPLLLLSVPKAQPLPVAREGASVASHPQQRRHADLPQSSFIYRTLTTSVLEKSKHTNVFPDSYVTKVHGSSWVGCWFNVLMNPI